MQSDSPLSPNPHGPGVSRESGGAGRTIFEATVVLVLSIAWFFWTAGPTELIQTEALRAEVAREMYEHDNWVPTIHERTYLRKLPLHAWVTSTLANIVGRFDEQVARWPSAAMGVLYVMTMFAAGRGFIDRRAGPAAAVFAAANWEVLDYGTRADLDIGVLAWTTLAMVILGASWMARGARRWWWLVGCYAAALVGSFWKAPHVFIVVGLGLLGLRWMDRSKSRQEWRRFVFHPVQIGLAALCLAIFAGWFLLLSKLVGGARAGNFVLIEALARLVPHSLTYVTEFILGIPQLAVVSFPASAFAVVLLSKTGRQWISGALSTSAGTAFLLAWLVPSAIFLLIVPAKAGRYWFLNLGAVTLLGALVWQRYVTATLPPRLDTACTKILHGLLVAGSLIGVGFVALALAIRVGSDVPVANAATAQLVCLICGLVALLSAGFGWWRRSRLSRSWLGALLAIAALSIKPVHAYVYVPSRAEAMSVRESVAAIEANVPEDATIFILSDKPGNDRAGELPSLGYYCKRTIRWPVDLETAIAQTEGDVSYFLLRQGARKRITKLLGDRGVSLVELPRYEEVTLMTVQLSRLECSDDLPFMCQRPANIDTD